MDVRRIQQALRQFAAERDWEQYHTPKNLATALVCEAAELAEVFQWLTPEQSAVAMEDAKQAEAIRHEIADVQIYLIRLADKLGVDLETVVDDKLAINASKYPIERARGNATKYSRRDE